MLLDSTQFGQVVKVVFLGVNRELVQFDRKGYTIQIGKFRSMTLLQTLKVHKEETPVLVITRFRSASVL